VSKLASFFETLGNKSPSTVAGYNSAIWQFIKFQYPDADRVQCAEYVDRYFSESRDYHTDFIKFIKTALKDKPGLSAL
jgi:hypothetical protein